jgi:hypothetical protein
MKKDLKTIFSLAALGCAAGFVIGLLLKPEKGQQPLRLPAPSKQTLPTDPRVNVGFRGIA